MGSQRVEHDWVDFHFYFQLSEIVRIWNCFQKAHPVDLAFIDNSWLNYKWLTSLTWLGDWTTKIVVAKSLNGYDDSYACEMMLFLGFHSLDCTLADWKTEKPGLGWPAECILEKGSLCSVLIQLLIFLPSLLPHPFLCISVKMSCRPCFVVSPQDALYEWESVW